MSTDISIRVPKVIATPAEFAEWEGYSRGSVYQMIHNGKLANYIEKKEKKRARIHSLPQIQKGPSEQKHGQVCIQLQRCSRLLSSIM